MNKKQARKALNCSQTELAGLIGVSAKYLNGLKILSDFHIRLIQGELEKRVLVDKKAKIVALVKDHAAEMDDLIKS